MKHRKLAVVVLGSSGFIGGSIAARLSSREYPVLGASSLDCDLTSTESTRGFFRGIVDDAVVVFCSAITRSVDDSAGAMLSNIRMADTFVRGVVDRQVRGVVFLSSLDVYGRTPALPITEATLPAPQSFYGISKLASEFILRRPGTLSCPVTILRLGGVFGEGDRGESVIGRLTRRVLRGEPVTIHGTGSVLRDYMAVHDVCRIVERALETLHDGVLNVASGGSSSINDLVRFIGDASGLQPRVEYGAADTSAAGDLVFDTRGLRDAYPELRFTSIRDGVQEYVEAVLHRPPCTR